MKCLLCKRYKGLELNTPTASREAHIEVDSMLRVKKNEDHFYVNKYCEKCALCLQRILHTAAARAERDVCGRQNCLGLAVLSDLGECVDNTTDKANENSRNTAKSDRGVEEDEATEGNWELVQGSDHGVCGGRCNADSPGGSV